MLHLVVVPAGYTGTRGGPTREDKVQTSLWSFQPFEDFVNILDKKATSA